LALAGLIFTAPSAGGNAQSGNKPTHRVFINIDGPGEPRSVEELLRRSASIVEATADGMEDRDIHVVPDDPNLVVRTGYRLHVTEVFKTLRPGKFPAVISVILPIGIRDRGTFIEEWATSRLLPLEVHHQYVLFLRSLDSGIPGNADNDFELATVGDSSVIEISNARATARDPFSPAASLATVGAAQLRSNLRARRTRTD
jgi:hypothetical protein